MTDTLTQAQIDECKILIQRYSKLDNEKMGIRVMIENILDDKYTELWKDHTFGQESKHDNADYCESVDTDEFPYFLENYFKALQDDREAEEDAIVCPRCDSSETQVVNVGMCHCNACGNGFPIGDDTK